MTLKQRTMSVVPGLVLCAAVMLAGLTGAEGIAYLLHNTGVLPADSGSPISGIFTAILLGLLIRNTAGLKGSLLQGVSFSVKVVLKAGIVLLGLRLSLTEALKLGAWGIPLIIACITAGLITTLYITSKLQLSGRLGTLIASGTGICGVTAIMATAPVIKAKENEISYAVANITIFGLIGMLVYPYLTGFFFAGEPVKAGLFLGTAIHDTAQVTGAALIYGEIINNEQVVDVATITKLTRNLFLIAVIPIVSALYWRRGEGRVSLPKWYKLVPYFIIGFFVMALLRTVGDSTAVETGQAFGLLRPAAWAAFAEGVSSFGSTYLLGIAMSGVGLSTNLSVFKGMGLKPFAVGFIAALSVGTVSLILILLFGDLITV